MQYEPEEVDAAVEKAESFAAGSRWQEVQRQLAPLRDHLGERPLALYLLAFAYSTLKHTEPARALAREAAESARRHRSGFHELWATNLLGIIDFETGRLEEARIHFEHALSLALQLGEDRVRAMIANNLGNLAGLQGRHETAHRYYQDALTTYRTIGEARGIAQTLHNLGIFHRDRGASAEADRLFTEAAREASLVEDHPLFATAVIARAELAIQRGRMDEAEQMARAAIVRFDVHSSLFGLAEAHKILGVVARERGEADEALRHFNRALEFCALHANPLIEAETRMERGVLIQRTGASEAGRNDLLAAADTFERLGTRGQAERARALAALPPTRAASPA